MSKHSLTVFDLMSDRHHEMRKLTEILWERTSTEPISNSELFILTKVNQVGKTTIANISKQVDISRQATHKFISRLKEKELVEVGNLAHNKKEKAISISPLGRKYVQINDSIKEDLDNKLSNSMGSEKLETLKEILSTDWKL